MRDALRERSRTIFLTGAIALAALVLTGLVLEYSSSQTNLRAEEAGDGAGRALEVFVVEGLAPGDSFRVLAQAVPSRTPFSIYLVDCDGLAELRRGMEPSVALARTSSDYFDDLELAERDAPAIRADCPLAGVVRWGVALPPEDADAQAYVFHQPAQTPAGRLVPWLALAAGATMALGVAAGHEIFRAPPREEIAPDASALETAIAMARKGELWLERVRRYLLWIGVAAFLPLYALLLLALVVLPGSRDAAEPLRWIALGIGALTVVGTAAWLRRLREADLELRAWREHVAKLKTIEDDVFTG